MASARRHQAALSPLYIYLRCRVRNNAMAPQREVHDQGCHDGRCIESGMVCSWTIGDAILGITSHLGRGDVTGELDMVALEDSRKHPRSA